ncbi:anhydro-N-acetylmuramic acid kinase [Methylomarinovum tepidoasis]|uniref:Anhydro-N-acetylmuramic acid kinase n=1 Tax=Methylomarinovum tepidoasis TaxID=2840183 RepID=A0AAU9D180_9GAMM|nr:anhydro-N-acetylmuramic acid kinase [Methylomarinovum sp. IN45]BCX88749.1 anhydro-N-acetylmuramic acid kinase [Methylomarinovum sp. IN45]
MSDRYIGLMAGTSLDGVDAVLAEIRGDRDIRTLAWHYHPFGAELRATLQRHCFGDQIPLPLLGELDAWLGETFARAALALLREAGIPPHKIRAIGSHGQTLHHGPDARHPYTLQIGDPNRIAALTGITTVADFRRRDIAVGGQGAPLVPAFHRAVFSQPGEDRAVLNLGGIANLTLLPGDGRPVTGFDTGPGNTLLDAWFRRHHPQGQWDEAGRWAALGTCNPALLRRLLTDPYFQRRPPKSTGPERFSLEWLAGHLRDFPDLPPEDVQASLIELTAVSAIDALRRTLPEASRLLVCGGGVHNPVLMAALAWHSPCPVTTTVACGIDPDQVEALAFAWLAWRTLAGKPGNLPSVTGAREEVILGAVYPA